MINIAHKKQGTYAIEFLQTNMKDENVDGLDLDVIMTGDEKIIYFTLVGQTIQEFTQLQTNDYQNIKKGQFLTLEEALDIISKNDYVKKITINIINVYDLTEKNLKDINERNNIFVSKILEIISQYKSLDFYLYSSDNSIVELLRINNRISKSGIKLSKDDLNFEDVDFYVISPNMINKSIIDMLLDKSKEVMINVVDNSELVVTLSTLSKNLELKNDIKYKNVYIISRYPEIVNKVLN